MVKKDYTPSDGIKRTIEGKQFGQEFRVYRIYGDVTKFDALHELAQMISCDFKVERVIIAR